MTSKLFHAVVGVGIALGTASACGGSLDDVLPATGPEEDAAATPDVRNDPPLRDGSAGDAPPVVADAGRDGAQDPLDAGRDARLEAFCDAAWPTTKGNPSPRCGAVQECADAGPSLECHPSLGEGCDGRFVAVWCVDRQWVCSSGAVTRASCKCFTADGGCP